jgi:Flp pilus assembly pilin Flp
MLCALWGSFWHDEQGADLAEFCLITALIVLVALGIFYHISGGVHDLWSTANTTLVNGSGPASSLAHSPANP